MDNNFQTSFIPKKALSEERVVAPARTSLFSFLATLIFFGALASAAGMYFYKASIQKDIQQKQASIEAAKNELEQSVLVQEQTLDRRLTDANGLLENHIAVTPIFTALQESTLKSVQYTKFTYTTPDTSTGAVQVHMTGRARDYTAIALESDNLTSNKNIHDPIFSNLNLETASGTVSFDLIFTVSPDFVHYVRNMTAPASDTTGTSPATGTGGVSASDQTVVPPTDTGAPTPVTPTPTSPKKTP